MSDQGRVIPVDIQGRRYPIRSTLDPHYIAQLAMYVEDKMRAAGDSGPGGDNLRTAVLAALNIADELFRCRESNRDRDGRLAERAEELERLLDAAISGA